MPDLLLEFFSEEIPARMQAKAAEDLRKLITDALVEAGLVYEGAQGFVTPRRLALSVHGIPARQPDVKDERKGPKVGAPEQAIAGFVKAAGLASINDAKVQADKKGDFYVAVIDKPGRAAIEVIAEIVPKIARAFPWPKSMRWGALSAQPGAPSWVRPLHSIIATFGGETEDTEIVKFDVGGIASGNTTRGHRFLAPDEITVKRFDDYVSKLEKAKVVLDPARRQQIILHDAKDLGLAQHLELVEDAGLLAEVAGLTEWPVCLIGSFDAEFLSIPQEVVRATIRINQKCFVLRDGKTGKLANKFIMVANTEASDGGKAIVAGCERVIRARLSDAKFFYETDLKTKLEDRLPKFEQIVFHEKLGTQAERIERIVRLAKEIAPLVKADPAKAERAARLAKTDLLTDVVGEFPELQGLMGKYYALAQGEDASVAAASEEHYKPAGPNDRVPTDPVSIAVALADKIDTLVGFWAIDEKPTGSKDPFALRRAALGINRLVIEDNLRISLAKTLWFPAFVANYKNIWGHVSEAMTALSETTTKALLDASYAGDKAAKSKLAEQLVSLGESFSKPDRYEKLEEIPADTPLFVQTNKIVSSLLSFFADRLKVQLREQGARHDLVDAVFALEGQDDLLLIVRRVEALGKFLDTDDGKNLLAGVKRAANILRIEEKKDGKSFTGTPDASLLKEPEEKALADAVGTAQKDASAAVAKEDFAAAMSAMAKLRPRVDAFFDKVTVNADDKALRENRLKLLNEIREATRAVADFSKIEG